MKAAAEEQGDKVIARKQEAYDKAVKDMATTSKDLEDENRKIKDGQSQAEKIKEHIDKDVIDMASPWIRVVTPMATPGGGTFFRPQKGDEVLINFDNDNVERPYVVGSLFSKNYLECPLDMLWIFQITLMRQRGLVEVQGAGHLARWKLIK